jgi:hypothetical protein
MRRVTPVLLASLLGLFLSALFAGEALAEVSVTLTTKKVVTKGGKESLVDAKEVRPGDIVEYTAVYQNDNAETVRELRPVMPMPRGVEYLAGSANPSRVEASVDGKEYGVAPLKKMVRDTNGKLEERAVPYAEYRYLRWYFESLKPRERVSVKARVKVAE